MRPFSRLAVLALLCGAASLALAGPLRDRLKERRAERMQQHGASELDDGAGGRVAKVPDGVKVVRNVAYGSDPAQRFDVYIPQGGAHNAPVVLMVHGGGWSRGDKSMATVVENKAARWVPRGVVFISMDYRMIPAANPLEQARDVARAAAAVQRRAGEWGGDGRKLVLMGHSAGAHLVTLVTSARDLGSEAGMQPWLGTVALDGAAYNVVEIMQHRHYGLYDAAFGTDQNLWRDASPIMRLDHATVPLLGVCSSRREDSCAQARAYEARTTALGSRMQVLSEDLSHREINDRLGEPGAYTDAVEAFLRSLDPALAGVFKSR
ncbi:MAG TPA: alpha/beta hydrolase [Telluria sp.]|nr:alpha/beta hydrolase [Telluria sp.]